MLFYFFNILFIFIFIMENDFFPLFESKIKFNHDKKLLRKFRIILVGASGSGKSFLFSF